MDTTGLNAAVNDATNKNPNADTLIRPERWTFYTTFPKCMLLVTLALHEWKGKQKAGSLPSGMAPSRAGGRTGAPPAAAAWSSQGPPEIRSAPEWGCAHCARCWLAGWRPAAGAWTENSCISARSPNRPACCLLEQPPWARLLFQKETLKWGPSPRRWIIWALTHSSGLCGDHAWCCNGSGGHRAWIGRSGDHRGNHGMPACGDGWWERWKGPEGEKNSPYGHLRRTGLRSDDCLGSGYLGRVGLNDLRGGSRGQLPERSRAWWDHHRGMKRMEGIRYPHRLHPDWLWCRDRGASLWDLALHHDDLPLGVSHQNHPRWNGLVDGDGILERRQINIPSLIIQDHRVQPGMKPWRFSHKRIPAGSSQCDHCIPSVMS